MSQESTGGGPTPVITLEAIQVIPDDEALIAILALEARKALRRAGWFRDYKRGQLVFKFDNKGQYKGVGIIIQD